jgi:hypothetical protein
VVLRWSNVKSGVSGQMSCTTTPGGSCSAAIGLSTKIDSATLSISSVAKDAVAYSSAENTNAGPVTVKRPR